MIIVLKERKLMCLFLLGLEALFSFGHCTALVQRFGFGFRKGGLNLH